MTIWMAEFILFTPSPWWSTHTASHATCWHGTAVWGSPSRLDELNLCNTHDHAVMLDWTFALVLSSDHIYKSIRGVSFFHNFEIHTFWTEDQVKVQIMNTCYQFHFLFFIYFFFLAGGGLIRSHSLIKRAVSVTQPHNSLCVLPFLSLLHNSWLYFSVGPAMLLKLPLFLQIPIFHYFHFFLLAWTNRGGLGMGKSGYHHDMQTTYRFVWMQCPWKMHPLYKDYRRFT